MLKLKLSLIVSALLFTSLSSACGCGKEHNENIDGACQAIAADRAHRSGPDWRQWPARRSRLPQGRRPGDDHSASPSDAGSPT